MKRTVDLKKQAPERYDQQTHRAAQKYQQLSVEDKARVDDYIDLILSKE